MKHLWLLFSILTLTACGSKSIKQYENENPKLVLENYFNGKMTAHGLVMNRSGEVTRRFIVTLNSTWKDNVGTLVEDFKWSDGEKSQRTWTIKKLSDGNYEGTAADILGVATGKSAGNAFNWTYKMDLKVKDTSYKVNFDDWMYLVDEKVLINKAVIYYFGIRTGEVLISFVKD